MGGSHSNMPSRYQFTDMTEDIMYKNRARQYDEYGRTYFPGVEDGPYQPRVEQRYNNVVPHQYTEHTSYNSIGPYQPSIGTHYNNMQPPLQRSLSESSMPMLQGAYLTTVPGTYQFSDMTSYQQPKPLERGSKHRKQYYSTEHMTFNNIGPYQETVQGQGYTIMPPYQHTQGGRLYSMGTYRDSEAGTISQFLMNPNQEVEDRTYHEIPPATLRPMGPMPGMVSNHRVSNNAAMGPMPGMVSNHRVSNNAAIGAMPGMVSMEGYMPSHKVSRKKGRSRADVKFLRNQAKYHKNKAYYY